MIFCHVLSAPVLAAFLRKDGFVSRQEAATDSSKLESRTLNNIHVFPKWVRGNVCQRWQTNPRWNFAVALGLLPSRLASLRGSFCPLWAVIA